MSIYAPEHLQTVAQARSVRSAKPKGEMVTRLEEKDAARKLDEKQLDIFKKAVWARDSYRDRFTGLKVVRTLELRANRAEAHHHEPRGNRDVRYDVRNGITLSASTHARFKAGTLGIATVEASRFYEVGGRVYMDVGGPLQFVDTSALHAIPETRP